MRLSTFFQRGNTGWPKHLPFLRIRTSTAGLIVAFIALSWLSQAYEPPPTEQPQVPQVVPPGFVPDPDYTWVPRTDVQPPQTFTTTEPTTTTPPTTTTTTTTSPTETTPTPTETVETTPPTPEPIVIDPDGEGPLGPVTITPPPPLFPPPAAEPGPEPAPATPPLPPQ